jgi:hypothetical protein
MLTSREWQPAITSFLESELDLAGATTHRSANMNQKPWKFGWLRTLGYMSIALASVIALAVGVFFLTYRATVGDVNRFFLSCEERHDWAIESGAIRGTDEDVAARLALRQGSFWDRIREDDRFCVFNTPHYMVFASVYHRLGRVTHVDFSGPYATTAVRSIRGDLDKVLPRLDYSVVDNE